MEKENQWLEECRKSIEASLAWGDSSLWTNDDFQQLSEKIWQKTRVRLSISTLKRIWGRVPYKNFPSAVTLNALAGLLDYGHWRDFCQSHQIHSIIPPGYKKDNTERKYSSRSIIRIVIGALVILGAVFFLLHILVSRKQYVDPAGFSFNSRKVTDDLPNSVVFNYDAGSAVNSKLMIQQSWDSSRREAIDAHGKQHTSIYYYPGYFHAKLLVNNRVVKETPVFIQTKGWKGIIGQKPLPVYLKDEEVRRGNGMKISDTLLKDKLNTSDFNHLRVQLVNIREFPGINANDFTLGTRFRNTSALEESLCRRVIVEILGTENVILIPFSTTGCIAELNLFTGDTTLLGKDHDLSAFGCDFSRLQNMKCVVSNKLLKIYLNDQLIMNTSQRYTLGRIVGIRILFEGAGEVQQVTIATPDKIVYDLMK